MIYDPPKDYYKVVIGCHTHGVYVFKSDNHDDQNRAFAAAMQKLDDLCDESLAIREKKGPRIIRWADGRLQQAFPPLPPSQRDYGAN